MWRHSYQIILVAMIRSAASFIDSHYLLQESLRMLAPIFYHGKMFNSIFSYGKVSCRIKKKKKEHRSEPFFFFFVAEMK